MEAEWKLFDWLQLVIFVIGCPEHFDFLTLRHLQA